MWRSLQHTLSLVEQLAAVFFVQGARHQEVLLILNRSPTDRAGSSCCILLVLPAAHLNL
jgi:hypothetical protein